MWQTIATTEDKDLGRIDFLSQVIHSEIWVRIEIRNEEETYRWQDFPPGNSAASVLLFYAQNGANHDALVKMCRLWAPVIKPRWRGPMYKRMKDRDARTA